MSTNATAQMLRMQFQSASWFLETTMNDVTPEMAHWHPPGLANPIGATYAHVVLLKDSLVNGIIKGSVPLFASSWAGKVGVSEFPPMPSDKGGLPDWFDWARQVQIDLPVIREYAKAVYASIDEFLDSLSDEDLQRPLEGFSVGPNQWTVGRFLSVAALADMLGHSGEIACIKGIQGVKGYAM